jgi:hypothetical protein
VQSADPRNCDDLPHSSSLDRPLFGSVLLQTEVRPIRVVVVDIRPDHSPELELKNVTNSNAVSNND